MMRSKPWQGLREAVYAFGAHGLGVRSGPASAFAHRMPAAGRAVDLSSGSPVAARFCLTLDSRSSAIGYCSAIAPVPPPSLPNSPHFQQRAPHSARVPARTPFQTVAVNLRALFQPLAGSLVCRQLVAAGRCVISSRSPLGVGRAGVALFLWRNVATAQSVVTART
jgi:hypothetical protein